METMNTTRAHYVIAGLLHYASRALEMGYITRADYDALILSIIEKHPHILN